MGRVVKDTKCPRCEETGHDSRANHLMVFEDGSALCKKSRYHESGLNYSEPAGSRDKGGVSLGVPLEALRVRSKRSLKGSGMNLSEIEQLPIAALTARGIDEDVCERYGVRVEYDEATREEKAYYFPLHHKGNIVGYKQRTLPKEFVIIGGTKGKVIELFGQSVCQQKGKKLLIVEGLEDCLAACQMLWRKYPNYPPNVLATGGIATKVIADNLEFLNQYEEVVICMDMDDPGQEAGDKIAQLVGPKAKIMKLPLKDANDMLLAGRGGEFVSAFFNAKGYAPAGFVTVDDVFEEATAMPVYGKPWPWPSMTKLTYGRRLGEGMYMGAGVKQGKSEAVNQIAHHIITVEQGKIALFKLEETPAMTVRKIAGKIMHRQFHKPDGGFTQEELIEGVNQVRNGVVLYDSYGSTSWDDLKMAIRHAVLSEGCQDIVIDPLTRLVTGMDSGEANTELERISDELSKMAKDLGFFYMVFSHLKAPTTGPSHEAGGKVQSNQFTGSRAMMRACYYMWGIERNKMAEDEEERNTSRFVLLEDRSFGNSGSFEVFYDRDTGDYLEPENKGY